MHKSQTEEEDLLKQLIEEIHLLNKKIDKLSLRISPKAKRKPSKKDRIKQRLKKEAAFSYAIGALTVGVSALLFSFSEQIAFSLYYSEGTLKKFYLYWYGCGFLLLGGILYIFCGYIAARYSDEIGTIRKFKIFKREIEIVTQWKRDIPTAISTVLSLLGAVLIAASFA